MKDILDRIDEKINPNIISDKNMQAMEDNYYKAVEGADNLTDLISSYVNQGGGGLDAELKLWKQINSLIKKSKLGKEL